MAFPDPIEIPTLLTRHLYGRHVRYRLRFHAPVHDAAETAEVEHVTGNWSAKVTVMIDGDAPLLFVMPAYANVDLARARTLTGRPRLTHASPERVKAHFPALDAEVIPPLRLWPEVEVWMDPSLRHDGPLLFPAGTHRAAVEMEFADWKRLVEPRVGRFVESTFIGA